MSLAIRGIFNGHHTNRTHIHHTRRTRRTHTHRTLIMQRVRLAIHIRLAFSQVLRGLPHVGVGTLSAA